MRSGRGGARAGGAINAVAAGEEEGREKIDFVRGGGAPARRGDVYYSEEPSRHEDSGGGDANSIYQGNLRASFPSSSAVSTLSVDTWRGHDRRVNPARTHPHPHPHPEPHRPHSQWLYPEATMVRRHGPPSYGSPPSRVPLDLRTQSSSTTVHHHALRGRQPLPPPPPPLKQEQVVDHDKIERSGLADPPKQPRGRVTAFLTELDRQDIMARIRRGEKQADLAKEYSVSRAAITNLKQRRQMLEMLESSSNVKDREEAQKRRRLSHGNNSNSNIIGGYGGDASLPPPLVKECGGGGGGGGSHVDSPILTSSLYRVDSDASESIASSSAALDEIQSSGLTDRPQLDSRSCPEKELGSRPLGHRELRAHTTSRLLSTLLDPETSDGAFHAAVARHTRLLLEEAIGWSFSQFPADQYNPVAISSGNLEAKICADEYARMEPATPLVTLGNVEQQISGQTIQITVSVPSIAVGKRPVFIFLGDFYHHQYPDPESPSLPDSPPDSSTSSSSSSSARQCIFLLHSLVFAGIPENDLVLVVSVCYQSVAQLLGKRFPDVHLVTCRFVNEHTSLDERTRWIGFQKRLEVARRLAPSNQFA